MIVKRRHVTVTAPQKLEITQGGWGLKIAKLKYGYGFIQHYTTICNIKKEKDQL